MRHVKSLSKEQAVRGKGWFVSIVEARRRSLAGQSHLDPVVHRATRGPTSPSSSYVPLRDPYTLQRLRHPTSHPLHPPSRRYTGSCDLRRGKLSTLTPQRRRREGEGRDICELFDRQTAVSLLRTPVAELFSLPFFFPPL